LRSGDLTRARFLTAFQPAPRRRISRGCRSKPGSDRGEDHVPRLALIHLTPQRLPLPKPRHIGGLRNGYATAIECVEMLGPDQQRVVERPRPKPRRESHRALPILTSHESINRTDQALLRPIELRLTRYSCFLPLLRHRVRLSQKPVVTSHCCEQGLRLPGTPGTHKRRAEVKVRDDRQEQY